VSGVDPAVQLARVPRRPPASDFAIVGALSVWAILEAFFAEGPGTVPVRIVAGLALTLPLIVRRRYPFAVLVFVVGVFVLRAVIGAESEQAASFFPALLLATFSVALYARRIELAVGGAVIAIAGMIAGLTLGFGTDEGTTTEPGNIAILSFFFTAAWTAGFLLRRRAEHVRRVEAESGELARAAVSSERSRIARELHDIVAHSISVISVQTGAAEQYVERDPARAREHLEAVRRSARDALTEMRRLTGVLREDEASYEPQPGLERMPDLVEQARASGLEVELVEEGERRMVPPGVDLAAYRIVQEALTNARKHAGRVTATVHVRYSNDDIEVEVENASGAGGTGDGSGHGLAGMRERVRVYGGTLEAGPEDGGRFRVRARLPLGGEA
jgi:signal transduction histidine kinase